MRMHDDSGHYIGVQTDARQRVCDVCGHRFLSGIIRLERTYSVAAICSRCVAKDPAVVQGATGSGRR